MFNLKSAFIGLFSAILISNSSFAEEVGHVPALLHNDTHTIIHNTKLEPISDSYKLAALQFLPDFKDSENGWAGHNLGSGHNRNDCSAYPLKSCPKGGTCAKCPFGKKYKLSSCKSGWKISGNSCVTNSCSALNKSYLESIPSNQICTKVTESGLNCYKDCRAVSCDGYKINCDNGVSGDNIVSSALCPDCNNANAKCSPKLCKITKCADGYKIANNGASCVALDDTCPDTYFKTCETGTQGDPKYTEKGTACYQCKPKEPEPCPSGQTRINGSCVECASSLNFKSMYGSIETAKKVSYNDIDYAVYASLNGGIAWSTVGRYCTAINYNRPDYNFAKYLIDNKNALGLDITVNDSGFVYTSTQCGSTQYLGCNSSTNCPCLSEESTFAHSYVCVKPLCSANITAETCPTGYSLNECGYGETQVGTTSSSLNNTCYKCESSGSGSTTCTGHSDCIAKGFCNFKKCYIPRYICAATNNCTSWDLQQSYANCLYDLGNGYRCCSECSTAVQ